jgi:hypothetical protein
MNWWRDGITILLAIGVPTAYLLFFGKERLLILIASLLFLAMGGFLLVAPTFEAGVRTKGEQVSVLVFVGSGFILLQICWMAVVLFSPLQQLTRRLGFVVLGVITLIALSEISKLNLHQYLQPPKESDTSLR